MEIIEIESMERAAQAMPELMMKSKPFFMYLTQPRESVIVGDESTVNWKEVERRGLFVTKLGTTGGTIVMNTGDIGIAIYGETLETSRSFVNIWRSFLKFLNGKGIDAIWDNNDICVNGRKICAISRTDLNESAEVLFLFQISVNVDLDAIKAICVKPMKKIPQGLSELGLTTEEIREWLDKFIGIGE